MDFATYKQFRIQIGTPGAWNANLFSNYIAYDYDHLPQTPGDFTAIDTNETFNAVIKHMPFSLMKKMKNVVTQTWKDEEGDDVWLPKNSDGKPVVFHEAVEFTVDFVFHLKEPDEHTNSAIDKLRKLVSVLEGRWLRIYDEYTGIGFDGVYLVDVDDDPKFRRREYTTVIFNLTFKANGLCNDTPFEISEN